MTRLHSAALLLLLSLAIGLSAGEPSRIESANFVPEGGWNRDDAAFLITSFVHGEAVSHELVGERGISAARHQLSYTLPIVSDRQTGLGDAMLNYRYQIIGDADSTFAVAPRLSVVLPTRSKFLGDAVSGVQLSVPASLNAGERITFHATPTATWTGGSSRPDLQLAHSVSFAATSRLSVMVDALFSSVPDEPSSFVARPSIQYAFEVPGGLIVAPALALPLGDARSGVMLYVGFERSLGR